MDQHMDYCVKSISDEPNETTYAAIESVKKGLEMYGPYDNVEKMMSVLLTQDWQ